MEEREKGESIAVRPTSFFSVVLFRIEVVVQDASASRLRTCQEFWDIDGIETYEFFLSSLLFVYSPLVLYRRDFNFPGIDRAYYRRRFKQEKNHR